MMMMMIIMMMIMIIIIIIIITIFCRVLRCLIYNLSKFVQVI